MLIQTDDIALQQAANDNGDECTPPGAPAHVQFINRDRTITEQLYAPIVAGHVHNRDRIISCLQVNDFTKYREAHIHLHAHTFGLPRCQVYNFVVFYHAELIFNIEVPQISVSDYTPTVYDAIWDLRGEPIEPYANEYWRYNARSVFTTPEAVKPWIAKMATGWTLREVLRYANASDAIALDNDAMQHMLRLAWCVTCQPMSSKSSLWLHPWHHRRLTLGELARLAGYYAQIDNDTLGADVGMALWHITQSVPTPICEWLLRQFELYLTEQWKIDWQCEYRHNGVKLNSDGVWTINDATGQDVKRFMLYDLRPQAYDYERFEKEAKLQFYNFGDL